MTSPPDQSGNVKRSWTRIDGVDLLRGLAIFFVLMNHVNMRLLFADVPYTHGFPKQVVSSLVWNGQRGVQIFFAISGFLITSTALRRWVNLSAVNVIDFYRLRFARIAPLLVLLLVVLSGLHQAGISGFIVSEKTGGLGRALLAALTFHINVLEASRGYLPGSWDILWSLSVEEMFYLFFPIACRTLGNTRLLLPMLIGFVVVGPFARTVLAHGNPVWQEYSYLGGMDAIAMGCVTAIILSRQKLSPNGIRICLALGIAFVAFILLLSRLAGRAGLERSGLDMSILAIGACLIIAACATTRWKSPQLLQPLLSLGQHSYEIYLTHMFVVLGFFGIFVRIGKPMRGVVPLFLAVILVSALLGALVARFYSEPLNRFLRRRWRENPGQLGTILEDAHPKSGIEAAPR